MNRKMITLGLTLPWFVIVATLAVWLFITPVWGESQTPAMPDNVKAKRMSDGIRLRWVVPDSIFEDASEDCSPYARHWQFQWKDMGDNLATFWQDASTGLGSHSLARFTYVDRENPGKFSAGKRYIFQMRAGVTNISDASDRLYSEWVTAYALWPSDADQRPDRPTGLTASEVTDGVKLRWDESSDHSVRKFNIRRYNTSGARNEVFFTVSNMKHAAKSYVDTTADADTSYGYFISAVNNKGAGVDSPGAYVDR